MADYKSNRSCTKDTVREALKIFGNNYDLKKGFQIFLPDNYPLDADLEFQKSEEQNDDLLVVSSNEESIIINDVEANEDDALLGQRRRENFKFLMVCTGIWLSVYSLVMYGIIKFLLIS